MNTKQNLISLMLLFGLAACGGNDNSGTIELLVANSQDNGLNGVVTTIDMSGQLIRSANINTSYASNGGIIADSFHDELFAVDDLGQQIKTYSLTATGNTSPTRTIVSSSFPGYGGYILYDPSSDQIIQIQRASSGGMQLAYYPRTGNGSISPDKTRYINLRTISSACLDSKNSEIFATVAQYAGQGPFPAEVASINAFSGISGDPSLRTISGDLTELTTPSAIAVDNIHDELLILDSTSNAILVFSRTDNGNISPLRSIIGNATGLNQPRAIAFDSFNDIIYVANYGGNSITAYPRTGNGNLAPVKSFGSPQLSLTNPTSITLSIH